MYEIVPLGALMLFNNIVDNDRDLPPLCSSMQQSNSLFLKKKNLSALLKMISLCGDSCCCSEVRDWYLWTYESGWGVEEEEQNVWQAFGKWKERGVKKVQHASFSLSLCSHRPSDGQGPQIQWVKCVPFQSPLLCNFPPGLPCSLFCHSLKNACPPPSHAHLPFHLPCCAQQHGDLKNLFLLTKYTPS